MLFTKSQQLLLSSIIISVKSLPSESPFQTSARKKIPNHQPDSVTISSYARQGGCFQYIKGINAEKAVEPCITYCKNTAPDTKASTCPGKTTKEQYTKDPSIIQRDDDGNEWVPARCECGGTVEKLATDIFDFVAVALHELPHIFCDVMLSALTQIVETGISFVPVAGQEFAATQLAVKAGKSFVQSGMKSGDMGDWAGTTCGVKQWPLDTAFDKLQKMPDAYGKSVGCGQKDKKDCKDIPAVPGEAKSKKSP